MCRPLKYWMRSAHTTASSTGCWASVIRWQGSVWGNATYVIRTAQDPATMANALRSAMHELDADLPLANVLTMREILSESIGGRRFQTLLAGTFAGAALLLACWGYTA